MTCRLSAHLFETVILHDQVLGQAQPGKSRRRSILGTCAASLDMRGRPFATSAFTSTDQLAAPGDCHSLCRCRHASQANDRARGGLVT
jgi:hypothetical protein